MPCMCSVLLWSSSSPELQCCDGDTTDVKHMHLHFNACLGAAPSIHPLVHYMLPKLQIRCAATDILWQPSMLPRPGITLTRRVRALQLAGTP